jgi:hypothetical protein
MNVNMNTSGKTRGRKTLELKKKQRRSEKENGRYMNRM